jgi:lysine 2,3-aminomutase
MQSWQNQLREALRSPEDLLQRNILQKTDAESLKNLEKKFQIHVTPYYADLIENTTDCPIFKQAIPHLDEIDPILPEWAKKLTQEIYQRCTPWSSDPIGDYKNCVTPRITHRYSKRALLHVSTLCAVSCRFCFRKVQLNKLSPQEELYLSPMDGALAYLLKNQEIEEIILTGGDPLSTSDLSLHRLFHQLDQIPHLKMVRIHTRMTVTLPVRFTDELLKVLTHTWHFQILIVSHFNHPKELTTLAKKTLKTLRQSGIPLLNQSVLLKEVNDSTSCLQELFETLYFTGVLPYYLHYPDWTPGTFHFRPGIHKGKAIFTQLQGRLSGPALPKYMLDLPSGHGKIDLMNNSHSKLEEFHNPKDSIHGTVYECTPPQNRNSSKKQLYLDLYRNTHNALNS